MTPPVGRAHLPVLGTPASLIGSELSRNGAPAFIVLCPVPMPQGVSYVQDGVVYIRNLTPEGWDLSLRHLALSGCGYAELRLEGVYEVSLPDCASRV
jgi:hypothetical protein